MKKNLPLISALGLAAGLRIAWKVYTGLTFEDAFITFRFARNLANGLGFVYNTGEPVYGSTTPLLTLLIAGWLRLFPDFVVFGASLLGLVAGVTSIYLVWKLIESQQIEPVHAVLVLGVLALSDKLWAHDMGGMETPLVVCAMLASYWLMVRKRSVWSGVMAGILLWVRVDGLFWVAVLALFAWVINRRFPYSFLAAVMLTYLPWVVYATLTFGSPVPYTVTAKLQAYYGTGQLPYWQNFLAMLNWLTPFSLPDISGVGVMAAAIITCAISFIGTLACRRKPWLMILPVFCIEEMLRLVLMGVTFETRYFVPFYWALMLLFGLGVVEIWNRVIPRFTRKKQIGLICLAIYCSVSLSFSFQKAMISKEAQYYVYDQSLKRAGLWLRENTPEAATVFLEPLGYIGFYSDRFMVDQVGLVSPRVLVLKSSGTMTTFGMATALSTEYVVMHCDDALDPPEPFLERYSLAVEINPLGFDPRNPYTGSVENASKELMAKIDYGRAACYQIWMQ